MKRFIVFALLLAAALGAMSGCRSGNKETNTSTGETGRTTVATIPKGEDMIPGPEDTISEDNGANKTEDPSDTTTNETYGGEEPSESSNNRIRPNRRVLP